MFRKRNKIDLGSTMFTEDDLEDRVSVNEFLYVNRRKLGSQIQKRQNEYMIDAQDPQLQKKSRS